MSNLFLKKDLTVEQLALVQSEMNLKQKQAVIAYILWFFLGILGAHRFYTKNFVMAIFMILTLGGFGIWTLIDVFFINGRINVLNQEIEAEIIQNVKAN